MSAHRWRGLATLAAATLALLLSATAQAYAVRKGQVVDARDRPVTLRGINWFGFETQNHVVHGLWSRSWRELAAQMKAQGINAVRLPVCPDTLHGAPIPQGSINAALNPDLDGLDSLQALDALVRGLDAQGFYILLDHHRPDCQGIAELWYTETYSEAQWIADLEALAQRYRDVPHVLGIDLKNEPHGAATWGTGNAATDFNVAAEHAAHAVLKSAPQWLVFVEGVQENPACSGSDPHFWGENLAPFACTPLDIPADRLVLAPHTYGPDVHAQPYFDAPDFPHNLEAIRERNFGQFLTQGYAVILGEFGGKYGEGDLRDKIWQDTLVDYLNRKGVRSGFYWALNPNSGDTGGLLRDDWKTWRDDKLALLRRLWSGGAESAPLIASAASPSSPSEVPSPKPPATAAPPPVSVAETGTLVPQLRMVSDWGAGYCMQVQVRNDGRTALRWHTLVPIEGRIDQLWNATRESSVGDDSKTRFSGVAWNAQLAPGTQTEFGFCALRGAADKSAPATPIAEAASGKSAFATRVAVDSDWGAGYCTRVQVQNTGHAAAEWRLTLDLDGELTQTWKGRFSGRSGHITVSGEDYNRRLAPGAGTDFGYCAAREVSSAHR